MSMTTERRKVLNEMLSAPDVDVDLLRDVGQELENALSVAETNLVNLSTRLTQESANMDAWVDKYNECRRQFAEAEQEREQFFVAYKAERIRTLGLEEENARLRALLKERLSQWPDEDWEDRVRAILGGGEE